MKVRRIAMLDFTLLSDRVVELMQVGGVLFFIALGAFAYILLTILINVFKYKKKIADKNDDYLICDVAYFIERGKRDAQEDSFYISPMTEMPDNGLIAAVSDGMGGLANGEDVSSYIISRLKESYPFNFDDTAEVAAILRQISDEIYEKYKLSSGATIKSPSICLPNSVRTASISRSRLWSVLARIAFSTPFPRFPYPSIPILIPIPYYLLVFRAPLQAVFRT